MKHSCKGVGRCKRPTGHKESTLGSWLRGSREGEELPPPNAGILKPRTLPGPFMAQQNRDVQNILCLLAKPQTDGIHHSGEILLIPEQSCWTPVHGQCPRSSFFALRSISFCSCSPHQLHSFSSTQSPGIQPTALLQTPQHTKHPRAQTLLLLSLSFMLINEQAIRESQWFYSVFASCWGWRCWRKHCRDGQSLTDTPAHSAFVCSLRCFKSVPPPTHCLTLHSIGLKCF